MTTQRYIIVEPEKYIGKWSDNIQLLITWLPLNIGTSGNVSVAIIEDVSTRLEVKTFPEQIVSIGELESWALTTFQEMSMVAQLTEKDNPILAQIWRNDINDDLIEPS